jgi:hypothetical protein
MTFVLLFRPPLILLVLLFATASFWIYRHHYYRYEPEIHSPEVH